MNTISKVTKLYVYKNTSYIVLITLIQFVHPNQYIININ